MFLKHASASMLGLLYFSLIGGFSAPKIVKVLDSTRYLTEHEKRTWRRLNETFDMVLACLETASALTVGGEGWKAVLRVRLLHSSVRIRILSSSSSSSSPSSSWDSEKDGLPINQEDMMATLLAFSVNVLDSIKKVNCHDSERLLSREEQEDYLHMWRLIGFYMG